VAGQPRHFGPKGLYRKCVQPAGVVPLDREPHAAVQPGGSLYGLQHSNPVSPEDAYLGPAANFGQPNDPMVGRRVAASMCSAAGLRFTTAATTLWALLA
jgi:hypothetical protein